MPLSTASSRRPSIVDGESVSTPGQMPGHDTAHHTEAGDRHPPAHRQPQGGSAGELSASSSRRTPMARFRASSSARASARSTSRFESSGNRREDDRADHALERRHVALRDQDGGSIDPHALVHGALSDAQRPELRVVGIRLPRRQHDHPELHRDESLRARAPGGGKSRKGRSAGVVRERSGGSLGRETAHRHRRSRHRA